MPYLRQRSLTGMPTSASFKIATIWLSVFRLLIVKLLWLSLKEILRVICIILRGSYNRNLFDQLLPLTLGFPRQNDDQCCPAESMHPLKARQSHLSPFQKDS